MALVAVFHGSKQQKQNAVAALTTFRAEKVQQYIQPDLDVKALLKMAAHVFNDTRDSA